MDRRSFLNLLVAATAAALAPVPVSTAFPIGGAWEKGRSMTIVKSAIPTNQWGEFFLQLADYLAAQARTALEPGTRFEIRAAYPTNYGTEQGFAWYASSAMQKDPGWTPSRITVGGAWVPEAGYYLLARDVA